MNRSLIAFPVAFLLAAAVGCGDNSSGSESSDDSATTATATITTTNGSVTVTEGNSMTESSQSGTDSGTESTTNGPSGDGDGDGDDPTGFVIEPCEEYDPMTAVPIPTHMVLVLDKSGSMFGNTWDHDNMPGTPEITRWNSLHNVVDQILTNYQDKIDFGVQLYPFANAQNTYGEPACQTSNMPEVATGPNNKNLIINAIPGAMVTNSYGGTPSQRGVESAITHLMTKPAEDNRTIMFISDGAANCTAGANIPGLFESYDNSLHTTVADAFNDHGITTYVVGIDIVNSVTPAVQDGNPDSVNPFQKLNQLAQEGGVPNMGNTQFYDSQNQIDLEAALDNIAQEAISCTVPLPEPPPEEDNVVIKVDGMEIPFLGIGVTECPMDETGWFWSVEFMELTLCGMACDDLQVSGELEAEFFCTIG